MIKNKTILPLRWAFNRYAKRLVKKHFHRVLLNAPRHTHDPNRSILLIGNHTSWWDGIAANLINQFIFNKTPHWPMLHSELKRSFIFPKIGAYSIEQGNRKAAIKMIDHTVELLSIPKNIVLFFPEGKTLPPYQSPGKFMSGLEWILKKKPDTQVILMGLSYLFMDEQFPEMRIQLSSPYNAKQTTSHELHCALSSLVQCLNQNLDINAFKLWIKGSTSFHKRFDFSTLD